MLFPFLEEQHKAFLQMLFAYLVFLSYRANARAKNLGWRIDYHMVTENLENQLERASILPEAKHSDHCPILLEVDF